MSEIHIDDIPEWIQDASTIWKIWKENDTNFIIIDKNLLKYKVNNLVDFINMLKLYDYWQLDEYPQSFWKYGNNNKKEVSEYLLPLINSNKNYSDYKIILEKILNNIFNIDDLEESLNIFSDNLNLDIGGNLISYVVKNKELTEELLINNNQFPLLKLINSSKVKINAELENVENKYINVTIFFSGYYDYLYNLKFSFRFGEYSYDDFLSFIDSIKNNYTSIVYAGFLLNQINPFIYYNKMLSISIEDFDGTDYFTSNFDIIIDDNNRNYICEQLLIIADELEKASKEIFPF